MRAKLLNSLDQFLDDYPGMSTSPHSDSGVCLRGKFHFNADVSGHEKIEDSYTLEIIVPEKYPREIPKVRENGGKIPRDGNYHINQDGSLCLGSPLRLLKKNYSFPNLSGFAKNCLIPFLYAVSYKLRNGGDFILGELPHGDQGIVDDYSQMFGLTEVSQIAQAIQLLGVEKKIANKQPCPCGCGKRLGVCSFHHKLNEFRKMAPLPWFKTHALYDWNRT